MPKVSDPLLRRIVPRLAEVRGLVGVVLGGSRARGTATATSDYDIGLYYGSAVPLDTAHLLDVVRELVDDPNSADVTSVGAWGPRIVGGGWLSIDGRKVDLLYRGVEPVRTVIAACRAGQISMTYQPGLPHGFCSAIWMGEVAICQPLYDPQGFIAELQGETTPYPSELQAALLRMFQWEILFSIENGEIAIARNERTHIAGCIYRALCCIGQVLFAFNQRYLINEKAALNEAAYFPHTISSLTERVDRLWAAFGRSDFRSALTDLRMLDADLRLLVSSKIRD